MTDLTVTPHLGLGLMSENVLMKELIFNEAIISLDILFSGSILNQTASVPSAPNDGDAYIVGASPTGVWTGKENAIAFFYNGWNFITPPANLRVYDASASAFLQFTGSVWEPVPPLAIVNLSDLANVSAGGPSDQQVLTWNAASSKWIAKTLVYPSASLAGLSDTLLPSSGAGTPVQGNVLTYDVTSHKWIAAVPTSGSTLAGCSDYDATTAIDAHDGWVAVWNKTSHKLTYISPNGLATVNSIQNIGDVHFAAAAEVNDQLTWNGASWGPAHHNTLFSFIGMTDGPMTFSGNAEKFMVVNDTEDALIFKSLGDLVGGTEFQLQHLADVPGSIGTTGQVLVVNSDRTAFVYATVAGAIHVRNASGEVDGGVSQMTFTGAVTVTEDSAGHVTVNVPAQQNLAPEVNGTGAGGAVTTLNFTGGVTGSYSGGVFTVAVTGVHRLADQDDVHFTSPADQDLLVYDNASSKWINKSIATAVQTVSGIAQPNTYETGPFAPPVSSMFGTNFQAGTATILSLANRGLLFAPTLNGPAPYHSCLFHTVAHATPPWTLTCRVNTNSYASAGHYSGIAIGRSAGGTIAFLGVSRGSDLGQEDNVLAGYASNTHAETQVGTVPKRFTWLRMSYDGTNILFAVSEDGILWAQLYSVAASTALGGIPDQCGLFQRLNSATTGNVGGLYTYYDDMDFPAASRTTYGYVNASIAGLADVDLSTPQANGQALVWNSTSHKWVPATVSGGGGGGGSATYPTGGTTGQALVKASNADNDVAWGTITGGGGGGGSTTLAGLTDVDETTAPTNNQVLTFNAATSKWLPRTASSGGSGGPNTGSAGTMPETWFNPPTASQFTLGNYGRGSVAYTTMTLTDNPIAGLIIANSDSGDNEGFKFRTRAIPTGMLGAFKFIARVRWEGYGQNNGSMGIGVASGTGGSSPKAEFVSRAFSIGATGHAPYGGYWDGSSYSDLTYGKLGETEWFKIEVQSQTVTTYLSRDGINWVLYDQHVFGVDVTHYGFSSSKYDQGVKPGSCPYFESTEFPGLLLS